MSKKWAAGNESQVENTALDEAQVERQQPSEA